MLGLAREINLGRKVNKILQILFWSSIIYLPIIFIKSIVMHDSFIERIVNLQTFFGGVYFHLWFLVSLIVAFLFVNYFSSNLKITQSLSISFVIILLCWITDLLRSCGIGHQEFYLFRLLMGASLVYLGYLYSVNIDRFHFNQTFLLYIIIFGIVSVLAESLLMYYFFGSEIHERQLPIGAVILAIGLLLFGIGKKKQMKHFCQSVVQSIR
ncbi:hypothetical protein AUQ09_17165 [Escherichia coli]|nr:hypothetical protein AUQ09_17165 [Escherichia coli]